MQNWIPNSTWGQSQQVETWNQNGLGFQSQHSLTEPQRSLENPFPFRFGNAFPSQYPSSQPLLQAFGSVPVNESQNMEGFSNFPLGVMKTFEERKQSIVQPKDPFVTSWNKHSTPPRPREYPQQQRNKTTHLLLSRCSQEFCQRDVIKQYFETIVPGKVVQVQVKPKRGSAIVSFLTEEDAEKALHSGAPQNEYRLRMRFFIPKDSRRRDSLGYRESYLSVDTSGNEEEFTTSKMDTEELPAFDTPLPSTSTESLEQSINWRPFGTSLEGKATIDEGVVVRKLKREMRFAPNMVSDDDEGEVEHIDDRGWRTAGEKQQLSSAHNLVGTCLEMCPPEERSRREAQRDLSIFEIDYTVPTMEGEPPKVDHSKAVKKYVRSAACQEAPKPNEIRPPHVLEKTMEYLIENIVDRKDCSFAEVHNFVRDRTRSIRQDFTFQGVRSEMTIEIIEKTVRFHILSEQKLCEEDPSVYSSRQNMEQLDKCLISLREIYRERRAKGLPSCPNEGEFQAYYILSHFDPHSVLAVCRELDVHVLKSRQVEFALKIYQAFRSSNYVGFFRLLHRASYLVACMMQQHFPFIRKSALFIMQKCYSRFPVIPLEELEEMLAFEDMEDALSFCESFGFVSDYLEDGTRVLRLDSRVSPEEWTKYHPRQSLKYIEPKSRGFSVKDIMMGSTEVVETPRIKDEGIANVKESSRMESRQQENNNRLEDVEKKPMTKLSADAPEFVPRSQQQVGPVSSTTKPMSFPLHSIYEEIKCDKNSDDQAKSFGERVDIEPRSQQAMEKVVPNNSMLLSKLQKDNNNIPSSAVRYATEKKPTIVSPLPTVNKERESIPKIEYSYSNNVSPKMPTGHLKRKMQFGSDEWLRRDKESLITEGKKSKIVEEEQLEVSADSVEESKNSGGFIGKETKIDKYENELWILNHISQGARLLEFLPQVRHLQQKYKALVSKSNVDTENSKELSTLIERSREIREQLLQFLEEVNATDIGNEDKKLMNAVRSVRRLCEDLKVFISEMISIQYQWKFEIEKMNNAARSFIRAPAEAVSTYTKANSSQTPKTSDHVHHMKRDLPKMESVDAKQLRHVVYMIIMKELGGLEEKEEQVITQGLKMLSFGQAKYKRNSSDFIVPLMDSCCKVIAVESVAVEHFCTIPKPFVLTVVVSDGRRTKWNLYKQELKSAISRNFSIAVALLVFVDVNDNYFGETLESDEITLELSDLQISGYVTSISVILTDRKHVHKYSNSKLRDIWGKLVNDAERIFQVSKYLYIYPFTSTGYYTALELAMNGVRLALDQLFLSYQSFETLCADNFVWIANKLFSISTVCLPENKYRENFDIVAKAFQKLRFSISQVANTFFESEPSKEDLMLFITDHTDQWWNSIEHTLESLLGPVATISLPIRLNRILEEREVPTKLVRRRNSRIGISQHNFPVSETFSSRESHEEAPSWFLLEKQRLTELEEKMRLCLFSIYYCLDILTLLLKGLNYSGYGCFKGFDGYKTRLSLISKINQFSTIGKTLFSFRTVPFLFYQESLKTEVDLE